jgi:hypothetical protein
MLKANELRGWLALEISGTACPNDIASHFVSVVSRSKGFENFATLL